MGWLREVNGYGRRRGGSCREDDGRGCRVWKGTVLAREEGVGRIGKESEGGTVRGATNEAGVGWVIREGVMQGGKEGYGRSGRKG